MRGNKTAGYTQPPASGFAHFRNGSLQFSLYLLHAER